MFVFILFLFFQASSAINGFQTSTVYENSSGNVTLLGPIGNPNSLIKITYVIGVHPPEFKVHDTLYDIMVNKINLNYCYYIYKINVYDYNKNRTYYNESHYDGHNDSEYMGYRREGELFVENVVVPDIINSDYDMVVDFHSNHGDDDEDWDNFYSGGVYKHGNFLCTDKEEKGMKYYPLSRNMVEYYLSKNPLLYDYYPDEDPDIAQYYPHDPDNPSYITRVIETGKRIFIYETYVGGLNMGDLLDTFLDSVDNTPPEQFGVNETNENLDNSNSTGDGLVIENINVNSNLNKTGFPIFLVIVFVCVLGLMYRIKK